jgi:hypothetical protein
MAMEVTSPPYHTNPTPETFQVRILDATGNNEYLFTLKRSFFEIAFSLPKVRIPFDSSRRRSGGSFGWHLKCVHLQ